MAKSKDLAKNNTGLNEPADSRLAAVRDLIFGENMQQYDKDFSEVSNQIDSLKQSADKNLTDLASNLEHKIEVLRKNTEVSLEKLSVDIDKKLAQLDDSKADRKKLGKALEKIALMLQG